jgi:hypothetical protein
MRRAPHVFAFGIEVALGEPMIDLALAVVALVAGGIVVELYSAAVSTVRNGDEHGFQLGFEAYHHTES